MTEFIFAHLWTIIGTLGGLSGIAVAALIIVAGVPIAAVLAAVISSFGKLVEFLKTPVGQGVAVVLLIAVALFIGDAHGHRSEMKLTAGKIADRDVYWKAQIAKAAKDFSADRKDRDKSVAAEIDKLVNNRLLEIKAQERAIAAMGTTNAKPSPQSNPCVLTPADLDAGSVRARRQKKRTAGAAAGTGAARN